MGTRDRARGSPSRTDNEDQHDDAERTRDDLRDVDASTSTGSVVVVHWHVRAAHHHRWKGHGARGWTVCVWGGAQPRSASLMFRTAEVPIDDYDKTSGRRLSEYPMWTCGVFQ